MALEQVQHGLWLAVAAENKVRIADGGAIPLLVEVLKGGSHEAKNQAGRALGNLAEHGNDVFFLSPSVVENLKVAATDGKGVAQEKAAEIMKMFSLDLTIPNGRGTRVAMFSARFDGGAILCYFDLVGSFLTHPSMVCPQSVSGAPCYLVFVRTAPFNQI